MLLLNNNTVHHDNSELPINKVIPDILYNIFTLAVYDSNPPEKTVLNISHVCRYWRKSALEWPALWGFINLESHPLFVDLFMRRSRDAPLALTWNSKYHTTTSSEIYIFSHASTVPPRLCSLTLYVPWAALITLHGFMKHSQLPLPLQLRRLDINLYLDRDYSVRRSRAKDLPLFTKLVDIFYLRELYIRGMDLPWLELPHRNLTHLAIRKPINLPPFSQLLVLLSNCPLLKELVLDLDDSDRAGWETIAITSPSVISNKLDFPRLTELSLLAIGKPSCCYIRQFSRHLQPLPGSLSQYKLGLSCQYGSDETTIQTTPFPSADVFFETIPSGILSHLSNHHYLSISLFDFQCTISGESASGPSRHSSGSWPASAFYISASETCGGLSVDYSLFLRLAHAMPQIKHLRLQLDASQLLALLDINDAFPCLHTLELVDCGAETLNTLSPGVNLNTLILQGPGVSSDEMLFDLVLRMGVDVLELKSYDVEENEWAEVISALRSEGVVVRVPEPTARA